MLGPLGTCVVLLVLAGRLGERRKSEVENASVGTLVIDEQNKQIVLVKNKGGWKEISSEEGFDKPRNRWGLPNGRTKPEDKNLFDTAWRETKEETGGLQVQIDHDPGLMVEVPAENHRRVAFVGYPVAGKIGIPKDKEILEVRWFPFRALWTADHSDKDYVDMYPNHRRMAQELFKRWQKLRH